MIAQPSPSAAHSREGGRSPAVRGLDGLTRLETAPQQMDGRGNKTPWAHRVRRLLQTLARAPRRPAPRQLHPHG